MRPFVFSALFFALGAVAYAAFTGRPSAAGPVETLAPGGVVMRVSDARRASLPARPPVQTRVGTVTYPVEGATETALLRSLLARGPRTDGGVFFGLTTAETDLHYRTVPSAAGCALADVAVDLEVTVTLPDWEPPPDAPPALRRDWGRFLDALRRHEDGHRRIAVEGAEVLHAAVAGLRRPTCEAATADGRRRVARFQVEAAAAHRRFDDETGHGRTQGAVWPVVRDEG